MSTTHGAGRGIHRINITARAIHGLPILRLSSIRHDRLVNTPRRNLRRIHVGPTTRGARAPRNAGAANIRTTTAIERPTGSIVPTAATAVALPRSEPLLLPLSCSRVKLRRGRRIVVNPLRKWNGLQFHAEPCRLPLSRWLRHRGRGYRHHLAVNKWRLHLLLHAVRKPLTPLRQPMTETPGCIRLHRPALEARPARHRVAAWAETGREAGAVDRDWLKGFDSVERGPEYPDLLFALPCRIEKPATP